MSIGSADLFKSVRLPISVGSMMAYLAMQMFTTVLPSVLEQSATSAIPLVHVGTSLGGGKGNGGQSEDEHTAPTFHGSAAFFKFVFLLFPLVVLFLSLSCYSRDSLLRLAILVFLIILHHGPQPSKSNTYDVRAHQGSQHCPPNQIINTLAQIRRATRNNAASTPVSTAWGEIDHRSKRNCNNRTWAKAMARKEHGVLGWINCVDYVTAGARTNPTRATCH